MFCITFLLSFDFLSHYRVGDGLSGINLLEHHNARGPLNWGWGDGLEFRHGRF
jgi:hypothetical protein